jgi:uncharacterized protein (DUF2147 family)
MHIVGARMKNHTFFALTCLSLLFVTSLAASASGGGAQTPPAIPEEARKHFVMGTTLFKDAKAHDDYVQVESQFKQAVELAPQWPEARYNLALAKEAAGDYSGAMSDLKLYQQFKLSESEARTVQDKMYALDARQQKTVSDAAAKVAAETARAKAQEQQFEGKWSYGGGEFIEILGPLSARLSGGFDVVKSGPDISIKGSNSLSRFHISGRNVKFTVTTDETWKGRGFSQHRHRDRVYDFTISDDGKTLSGTVREENSSAGSTIFPETTGDSKLSRQD